MMEFTSDKYCSIEDAWGSLLPPSIKSEKKKKKKSKEAICNNLPEFYNMASTYNEVDMLRTVNDSERIVKSKYQKAQQNKRERNRKYISIDAIDPVDPEFVPVYEKNKSDDITLDRQFYNAMEGAQCNRSYMKLPDLESHFNPLTDGVEDDMDDDGDEEMSQVNQDYKDFKHLLEKKQDDEQSKHDDDANDDDTNDDNDEYHKNRMRNLLSPSFAEPNKVKMSNDFTEDFINEKQDTRNRYLDLILYIVSGIILIFVMEQFVKIGILLQH